MNEESTEERTYQPQSPQKIEKFEIDESNIKARNSIPNYNENTNSNNQNPPNRNEDYLEKIKQTYSDFITNKQVRSVMCPFDEESEGCQICYKVCATITCLIFLLVLYLICIYK